jgi:transposase-like protein
VEIDETYVGGAKPGKRGWGAAGKAMVLVATEVDGRKVGRIRLARTTDGTAANLEAFVQMSVELGSIIRTDGNQSYCGLPALGYRHEVIVMKDAEGDETKMLPQTHLVASLLKRWLLGTHQGGVQHHWLDYYLDEFTFRFNRRTSQARGQLFYRLIQQAVQVGPASYDAIITIHHPIRLQKMGLLQSSG